MLNFDELGQAYGMGFYNRKEHDIIADTYVKGRKTFHYRANPSMTRRQAFKCHLLNIQREIKRDYYKEEKGKVYFDDLGELAASGEYYFGENNSRFCSGQGEYSANPAMVLNKILVQEVKAFVNNLISCHKKKTLQMLFLYYDKNLTFEQIGKKLKCSKSTVERRIKRAMAQLSAIVQRKGLEYQNYTRCESKFVEYTICRQPRLREQLETAE